MGCGNSSQASTAAAAPGEKEEQPGEAAPATLYVYPGSAPCRAALFVVEAANIPVDIKIVDIMKEEQMQEWFVKINPSHTVPVLVDGSEKISESRAIMKYLMDKYAPTNALYPSKERPEQRLMVDKMLEYDELNVYKHVTSYIYPQVLKNQPANPTKEMEMKRTLDQLNENLSEQHFMAGANVTIADHTICANISLLELKEYSFAKWTNLVEWQKKMADLPYYEQVQKGLEDWKEFVKRGKGGAKHSVCGSSASCDSKEKDNV